LSRREVPADEMPAQALFDALVGQERAVSALRAAARLPVHAYLFVGRPGSGARAVFERQRRRYGLSVSELPGWEVVLPGHLPVAAAVASGLASTGVTCEPAARVYGLGFASMTTEQFDLVVPRDLLGLPEVRGLMAVLGADGLRRQLFSIEGYDAGRCGEVLDSF
jgi:putative molybdopterin biosynthesis protein